MSHISMIVILFYLSSLHSHVLQQQCKEARVRLQLEPSISQIVKILLFTRHLNVLVYLYGILIRSGNRMKHLRKVLIFII